MRQTLLILMSFGSLVTAQIPLNMDPNVRGQMHVSVAEEMAEMLSAEVSADFAYDSAVNAMMAAEKAAENELLKERGSLTNADGTPIPGNENAGEQIIDPRTPKGFGNPFFRKLHVEINSEMNMSPMMTEALSNTTSDIELPKGCTDLETCIDHDRDGFSDAVQKWELLFERNVTVANKHYKEEVDNVINRTTYWNQSKVDYVTSELCITSYGSKSCTTKEYVINENAWDLEVSLFPDGICPHPCECVASMGATKKKGKELVEKCFDYCAGSTLLDIFNCNMLRSAGEKNRMILKTLLDERMPGWGPGLTMKRDHPLAKEVSRFMGVF